MLFKWWRDRRRRQLLESPFPIDWDEILVRRFRPYGQLSHREIVHLQRDLRWMIAEKSWEGCTGLILTDEHRVTIAAYASYLGLGFDQPPYDHLKSILVYPDAYLVKQEAAGPDGVVREWNEPRLGEAWYRGPVIVAWREVEDDLEANHGRNVILHEFSHQLDMLNGAADGIPAIEDRKLADEWLAAWPEEMKKHRRRLRWGLETPIDEYGAKNAAEFFAVSTEAFFVSPDALLENHPELYQLLARYYRQDPANRVTSP